MFEVLAIVLFFWLLFVSVKLVWKVAWCTAKIIASVLFVIAVPLFIVSLIFASGFILLIPIALVGLAFIILKMVL